jgi:hypothetical protein
MLDPLAIKTAVDTVNEKTVPLLEAAVQRQIDRLPKLLADAIDRAMLQESNILKGVSESIAADIDRIDTIIQRVEALIARVDGATATIALGRVKL